MADWSQYGSIRYSGHHYFGPSKSGQIVSAVDNETGKKVVLKRVKGLTKFALREVRFSRLLQHENILGLEGFFLQDDCLVKAYPCMESDLARVIHNVSDQQCQFFVYQILRGLKYIHSSGLVHRSLTPAHLLINSNCELRLAHLETLIYDTRTNTPLRLPETQQDRWYFSPERLLGKGGSRQDDMWAVGCILGEMLLGRVLFQGQSANDQLTEIVSVIDGPGECDLDFFESVFTVQALKKLSKIELNSFSTLFQKVNPLAKSLLAGLLAFNPEDRISVTEALEHEYLSDFHDYEDEPEGEAVQEKHYEIQKLSTRDIRQKLEKQLQKLSEKSL